MRRLAAATITIGLAVAFAPTAHAEEEFDYTIGQQCVQYDGTRLDHGSFRIVWPTQRAGANGYVIPEGSTGTLLYNYPWPCGPVLPEPTPEPLVEPAPVEVVAEPVAALVINPPAAVTVNPPSPFVAIAEAMLDLQAILVANGGW